MSTFTVASRGVSHPQWIIDYYPDDIPEDWRLTYFANEFNACVLTLSELEAMECDISELSEDLPKSFKCYIELDCMPDKDIDLQGTAIAGILIAEVCKVDAMFCEYLLSVAKPVGYLECKLGDGILPACHIFEHVQQLHCSLISPDEASNLRSLKTRLLSLNRLTDHLIILDSGAQIVQLRHLQTLINLTEKA